MIDTLIHAWNAIAPTVGTYFLIPLLLAQSLIFTCMFVAPLELLGEWLNWGCHLSCNTKAQIILTLIWIICGLVAIYAAIPPPPPPVPVPAPDKKDGKDKTKPQLRLSPDEGFGLFVVVISLVWAFNLQLSMPMGICGPV